MDRSRSRISSPTHQQNDAGLNEAHDSSENVRVEDDITPVRRSSVMSLRLASSRSIGLHSFIISSVVINVINLIWIKKLD